MLFRSFPSALSQIAAFNSVGTINIFGIYLIAMSVFSLSVWVAHKDGDSLLHKGWLGSLEQVAIVALSLLTFLVLLTVDYSVLWLLFVIGIGLIFTLVIFRSSYIPNNNRFWLPAILIAASLPFWFWLPRPITADLPLEV